MATGTIKFENSMIQYSARTKDIKSEVANINRPCIFEGDGSAYTGEVPKDTMKYGVFLVIPRGGDKFVVSICTSGIRTCRYSGGSWTEWV